MLTRIQKWGNSQGLRFTKAILEEAQISVGDEVKVTAHKGRIVVEAVRMVRGRYDLAELVSRMPRDYRVEEAGWKSPGGREVW